ncbi:efflux transporter outer membrane subunit [Lysobacter sp. D1-1-M9]|uniref:efflux transporter outer membrane subunit n=1 Tax=Novilysobacter longmucuonensis TaxID=3098603 RepID=UPI002FC793FC
MRNDKLSAASGTVSRLAAQGCGEGKRAATPPSAAGPIPRARMLVSVLALSLAACTAGPEFVRPTPAVPAQFAQAATLEDSAPGLGAAADAVSAPDTEFWRGFDDPLLTRLVEEALLSNHDLRMALTRIDRANALLRGARLERLPSVTATAGAGETRASADQLPGFAREARDGDSFEAAVVAGWELDLFGRLRRQVEAQGADARASAADLHALQVAIVGEVTRGYAELRGLQERLRVARENAENQRETLRLVEARLDAGRGAEFDRSRARAQLETTLSRVPGLQAQVATTMHRLAVLSGRMPGELVAQLEAPRPLPALPALLDPGAPGALLRRRPDVLAAEHRLHAANARIGIASADLFPRFTLGGLIGSHAVDRGALFGRDSETRLLALGVDWSFLDIGRVRARIAAADADAEGALARYQQTVLFALEDTENALVRYARARAEDAHLQRAASDSARAAQLARIRFEAGAADLFEVLEAERTRLQAQDALAAGRTRSLTGAVAVYQALAGGWPGSVPLRESLGAR